MDEARAEALSERIFTETVDGMGLLAVYLGHRLGLFKELANNGTVFIADEAGEEGFSDNNNHPLGRFFYNVSVLHCLPQAMVFPDAAGTGTAISESTVRKYAYEAGFSSATVIDIENPLFRFYQLTP